jgi:hypothetical protein
VKTFEILLLAEKVYHLPATALTWIGGLSDPKFPTSFDMQPYTDDEIKERQLAAELQLDYYTKGLLEIATDDSVHRDQQDLFFVKRVQLFRRTLRGFVSKSKQLRDFPAELPGFMG